MPKLGFKSCKKAHGSEKVVKVGRFSIRTQTFLINKPDRSITRSFRVNEAALKVIEAEAESQGVTVNTFVNQLFTRYVKVQRFLAKERWFEFPEPVLKDVFALLPEDKVTELGKKHGKTTGFQNLLRAMTGGSSASSFFQYMKMICDINSINYTDIEDGRTRRFAIMHDVNKQFSIFLANQVSSALENCGVFPKVISDDRVVVFEFET